MAKLVHCAVLCIGVRCWGDSGARRFDTHTSWARYGSRECASNNAGKPSDTGAIHCTAHSTKTTKPAPCTMSEGLCLATFRTGTKPKRRFDGTQRGVSSLPPTKDKFIKVDLRFVVDVKCVNTVIIVSRRFPPSACPRVRCCSGERAAPQRSAAVSAP